ncbi:hypothetical protein FACS189440_01390 [Bacteroidia bacterium]|nr:hypothetical protein FACS189440_01390 [Bacteroidia bacterium]
MSNLVTKEYQSFEQIKQVDENGNEFWSARELAPVLEYAKWENFQKVIDRAMLSCKNSGYKLCDHFPDVRKTVTMPSGAHPKNIQDYKLSRYACYLIVQNDSFGSDEVLPRSNYPSRFYLRINTIKTKSHVNCI